MTPLSKIARWGAIRAIRLARAVLGAAATQPDKRANMAPKETIVGDNRFGNLKITVDSLSKPVTRGDFLAFVDATALSLTDRAYARGGLIGAILGEFASALQDGRFEVESRCDLEGRSSGQLTSMTADYGESPAIRTAHTAKPYGMGGLTGRDRSKDAPNPPVSVSENG